MDRAHLKIELQLSAQKLITQVMLENELLQKDFEKLIEEAIREIIDQDNFDQFVKREVKDKIYEAIEKVIFPYELQQKIQKALTEKIDHKINDYAEKIANKLLSDIT